MRILIADDDVFSSNTLQHQLKQWGHMVVLAQTRAAIWQEIKSDDPPELLFLHPAISDINISEICQHFHGEMGVAAGHIVLLAQQSNDIAIGIKAGIDDYIKKPFNVHDLALRIRAGKRIIELQRALQRESTTDSLTGLYNHKAIHSILCRELQRSQRMNHSLAVVVLDIDNFKHINDTYGHLAGDDCLKEVTRRLSSSLRAYDSIGRWGGEEFLIVLPGCRINAANIIVERLRSSIANELVTAIDFVIAVTISAGIACTGASPIQNATTLIEGADRALYLAKGAGRNRVHTFEELPRQEPSSKGNASKELICNPVLLDGRRDC